MAPPAERAAPSVAVRGARATRATRTRTLTLALALTLTLALALALTLILTLALALALALTQVLECESDASAEELRKAYRRAALRWHPDKHACDEPSKQLLADAKFKEVAAAWAVLGDEEMRAAYDADLERGMPRTE